VFGLGRTEDIPLIAMIELLFGLEKGAGFSRPYYGIKTGYSFHNDHLGYFYGGFQSGAFRSHEEWLNRSSILELLYFSDLYAVGKFKWRHYIGSRYSYSFDPSRPQDGLNINGQGGLRGFSDSYLRGNRKLVLNYEADVFVPLRFLGFQLGVILFADFGLISSSNSSLWSSVLYQGYGLGFRIRNEHLVFPQFQFMFGFYPNTPQGSEEHFTMFQQSSMFYRFNQFQFSVPSIVSVE
jgi:hemolysin activation/secretion protein